MKSPSFKRRLLSGALLGVCALAGAVGPAAAASLLQIVDGAGGAPGAGPQEVTGDAGGTNYGVGYGTFNGPGVPSARAGWPNGPGFAADPSFGGATGTSGYHSSYLKLTKDANVKFQYMGRGDASLVNSFWLDTDQNGSYETELFRNNKTTACAMLGGTAPVCDVLAGGIDAGQNQYSFFLHAGLIPFMYRTGNGIDLENDGLGNPDPHTQDGSPGYFVGMDPYRIGSPFATEGKYAYVGLSDLPAVGDHDFQDMGVRISVPEPGSLALLGAALGGMAWVRRRTAKP